MIDHDQTTIIEAPEVISPSPSLSHAKPTTEAEVPEKKCQLLGPFKKLPFLAPNHGKKTTKQVSSIPTKAKSMLKKATFLQVAATTPMILPSKTQA